LRFNLNKATWAVVRIAAVHADVLLPVELMGSGEWGDVAEVSGEPHWVGRMAELGVRAGSRLQVLQPGSPCVLLVGSSRLSLRGDLAMQILVRPVSRAG
jgi:ferrous iron transport protein A